MTTSLARVAIMSDDQIQLPPLLPEQSISQRRDDESAGPTGMRRVVVCAESTVSAAGAIALGVFAGLFLGGDGNLGHLLCLAVCGLCGWIFWYRRGKSVPVSVLLCLVAVLCSWPVGRGFRDATHVVMPDLLLGQQIVRWLGRLVRAVLFLAGIVWWRRTRNWLLLGLTTTPLGLLIGYLALRSPESARIDRIESCGLMVTGEATDGYGISLFWDRSDEVIEAAHEDLRALPGLDHASVYSKNVTDRGISLLAHLPNIESMELASVHLSRNGFQSLSQMPRLRTLRLRAVECRADDLEGLSNSTSLEILAVSECALGDAATEHVARIETLRRVHFFDTAVSAGAVANLRMKRPDLEVSHTSPRELPATRKRSSKREARAETGRRTKR